MKLSEASDPGYGKFYIGKTYTSATGAELSISDIYIEGGRSPMAYVTYHYIDGKNKGTETTSMTNFIKNLKN